MLIAYLLTNIAASPLRTLRAIGTAATIAATFAIVAYAELYAADAAARAHVVVQGLGVVALTLLAALLAGIVHYAGVRFEQRLAARAASIKTRSAVAH